MKCSGLDMGSLPGNFMVSIYNKDYGLASKPDAFTLTLFREYTCTLINHT
jgi:hypothetical protein